MPAMTNSKPFLVRLSKPQQAALEEYLTAHPDKTASDVFRDGMLRVIGRKDLKDTMRGRGQPKKNADGEGKS